MFKYLSILTLFIGCSTQNESPKPQDTLIVEDWELTQMDSILQELNTEETERLIYWYGNRGFSFD